MGKIINTPENIFLQVDPGNCIADDPESIIDWPDLDHEITWCVDAINDSDIIYTREDLLHKTADALSALLIACWIADAQADLSGEIDGSLMDTARIVLDKIPNYDWRPK